MHSYLTLVKYLLGPILLIQGTRVKRNTIRLPEPTGSREGNVGSGPPVRLLLLGDSAAAGVGVDTMEEGLLGQIKKNLASEFDLSYKMIARTGATTKSTLKKLAKVKAEVFDVVVISLGVNDVTSNTSLDVFLERQRQLVTLLREKFGVAQVIISGYPPVGLFPALPQPLRWYLGKQSRFYDRELRSLANELNCDFLNMNITGDVSFMARDGFHPGPKVYAIWGEMVAEKVRGKR